MLATRYANDKPIQSKPVVAEVDHVSPPLKGLNLSSANLSPGTLTAPILTNFIIQEDRICARAGYRKVSTHADGQVINQLIPHYGDAPKLLAATNKKLADAMSGADLKTGFQSDDWSFTAFANLGQDKYTVMVNGADGVWSWNGGSVQDGPSVTVTNLSNANPAVVTVAAGDIGQFHNGQTVVVAGADAQHVAANGTHIIGNVGTPVNTFQLLGVDLSHATAAQTTGVTVRTAGSFVKEPVTASSADSWVTPNLFQIVVAHMNRLFFADGTNLAIYYLPTQQKSGEVKVLPLNALFKRGGTIRALATWTIAGVTLNDMLVVFTSNGECVIFMGIDPDTDWQVSGVFRFNPPMSRDSVANYGGDLYVMIPTGVVPITTLIASEGDALSEYDKSVLSIFLRDANLWKDRAGWQLLLNPSSGRLICNMPSAGVSQYGQLVRHMPQPLWSQWRDIPSRCWQWIDPYLYFGDDTGSVYRMHPQFQSDDGRPIYVDVMPSFSQFRSSSIKQFKMVQAYIVTDGRPLPWLDVKVKYDFSPPINQPEVSFSEAGAEWDVSAWDAEFWAGGTLQPWIIKTGVGAIGHVGAPRLAARVLDCTFEVTGFDVSYEVGAPFA
jgi:hypothetical protein